MKRTFRQYILNSGHMPGIVLEKTLTKALNKYTGKIVVMMTNLHDTELSFHHM